MSGRPFKLMDDDDSAIASGTPFRVCFFISKQERFLYFKTRGEAFVFVQNNPTAEALEIKDLESLETLYPKQP